MSLCQLLVGWLPPSYIIFWRSFPYNLGQFSSNKNIVAKQKISCTFRSKNEEATSNSLSLSTNTLPIPKGMFGYILVCTLTYAVQLTYIGSM